MKRILILSLFVHTLGAVIFESDLRTFTDIEGRTVEAKMDHYNSKDQVVTIRLENGRKYDIPFERLSAEDQSYCKEWKRDYDASFVRIDFFTNRIQGGRIVFILDSSGSMKGDRWDKMVRNMNGIIERLDSGAEFNIIHFGSRAYSFHQDLIAADSDSKQAAIDWLNSQQPSGGTNLLSGIRAAKKCEKARVYAVLSDGYPSNSPASIFEAVQDNQEANGRLIEVYTVSYQSSSDGILFLKDFAKRFNGKFAKR